MANLTLPKLGAPISLTYQRALTLGLPLVSAPAAQIVSAFGTPFDLQSLGPVGFQVQSSVLGENPIAFWNAHMKPGDVTYTSFGHRSTLTQVNQGIRMLGSVEGTDVMATVLAAAPAFGPDYIFYSDETTNVAATMLTNLQTATTAVHNAGFKIIYAPLGNALNNNYVGTPGLITTPDGVMYQAQGTLEGTVDPVTFGSQVAATLAGFRALAPNNKYGVQVSDAPLQDPNEPFQTIVNNMVQVMVQAKPNFATMIFYTPPSVVWQSVLQLFRPA